MRFFTGFCNGGFAVFRHRFRLAEALALDDDAVGTVTQPVECRGAENPVVGEGVTPFAEIEIGCQDGGHPLIPGRHQVVEVFVVWCAQGFEREVVDDQQWHTHELLELAFVEARGAGRMQLPCILKLMIFNRRSRRLWSL